MGPFWRRRWYTWRWRSNFSTAGEEGVRYVGADTLHPRVLRTITLGELSFSLQGKSELGRPPALLVKELLPSLARLEYEIREEGLHLWGRVRVLCLYVGTDNGVHSREVELVFDRVFPGDDFARHPVLELEPRLAVSHFALEVYPGRGFGTGVLWELAITVRVRAQEILPSAALLLSPGSAQEAVTAEAEKVIGTRTLKFMHEHRLELAYASNRIVEVKTGVKELAGRPVKGQILLEGTLAQEVFYVGPDGVLHHQEEAIPLAGNAAMPGVEEGMKLQLSPRVTGVKYRLGGERGRLLEEKVFLEVEVKVTSRARVRVLTGAEEPGPALEREIIYLERVVATGKGQEVLENVLPLRRPAREVVRAEGTVLEVGSRVLPGKVLLQGVIREDIYPVGEDGLEYHQEQELTFSSHLELAGVAPGMEVRVTPVVDNIYPRLEPGGQTLKQRLFLTLMVTVLEGGFLPVVTGVQGSGWETKWELLEVERLVGEATGKVLEEAETELLRYARRVSQIEARAGNITWELIAGKVLVAGEIREQIYYVTREMTEYHQQCSLPFSHYLEVPGARPGMGARVEAVVEYLQHTLNPDGDILSQKIMLQLSVSVSEGVQRRVVTELVPRQEQEVLPLLAEEECTIILENWLDIPRPPVRHVLEWQARLQGVKYRAGRGVVTITGTVVQQVYFVAADNRLHYYREDTPFTQAVELPEAAGGARVQGGARIRETTGELFLLPGRDTGRRLRLRHCLEVNLRLAGEDDIVPG